MLVHSLDALVLALLLSVHGFRKKSLSPDGALAAFVVGFGIMSSAVKAFGVGLIVLYFVGSRATRYGKKQKARLEEGYHEAGYRTSWQVLCNSLVAFVGTALWDAYFVPKSIHALVGRGIGMRAPSDMPVYARGSWCPTDGRMGNGLSRLLFYAILGQLGCCLGDTLASEMGILSQTRPRLITTLQPVPPGTNGAITPGGTAWSIIGGVLVGSAMGASMKVENGACGWEMVWESMWWGGVAGGIGSMIDSVLGATVQATVYDGERGRVGTGRERIGGRDVLTNSQVNLISSTVAALLIGWLTSR